jgi:hypothetical protein
LVSKSNDSRERTRRRIHVYDNSSRQSWRFNTGAKDLQSRRQ